MALLVAGIVAAVWYVVFDLFLMGPILGSSLTGIPGMNPSPVTMWVIIGDLASCLVLAAVYARTRSVFGVGLKGGATYGVYAGVLVNFPLWLMMSVYVSWPYGASWMMTIAGIVVTAVAGGLIGLVYEKLGRPAAA
jgi:hypothetical protein